MGKRTALLGLLGRTVIVDLNPLKNLSNVWYFKVDSTSRRFMRKVALLQRQRGAGF
jgi:hypothetical protein